MKQNVEGVFQELKILVITDIHYDRNDNNSSIIRQKSMGLEFIKKVRASIINKNIDLVILLGDIIDNGNSAQAIEYLHEIKEELEKFNIDYIVVPGNHDRVPKKIDDIFGKCEGIHNIKDYQIITFSDKYNENDQSERDIEKMTKLFKNVNINKTTIVFQHNPIYPLLGEIGGYPFDMINSEQVSKFYTKNNVLLSVSGHYHQGIQESEKEGVKYITCPALCEAPFRYSIISFRGFDYNIQEFCLI